MSTPAKARRSNRGQAAARDVRLRIDEQLRNEFSGFMRYGTREEKWLLWDVLCTQANCHRVSEESLEIGIASAFEECISQRGYYVRVEREDQVPRVIEFIQQEKEFSDLVQTWRLEHPEPAQKGTNRAGIR
jgi:hypothetical protein